MITRVDPHYVMGRIKPDNTYFRRWQISDNVHHDKILRYGIGEYLVFKTNSTVLKISYVCHFHLTSNTFTKKQCVESSILGYDKNDNTWHYLNTALGFSPKTGKSDDVFEIDFVLNKKYDKYQIVLPEHGVIHYYTIESDEPVEFEYKDIDIILLGSSVGQFGNDCNHMTLCAYMYRKYGLNVATVAISKYHTFENEVLMDFLSTQTGKLMIVCDLEHCTEDMYKNVDKLQERPVYMVIKNLIHNWCEDLEVNHPEIESFLPPETWMHDSKHLNSYGIIEYSKMIMEKYEQYKK